EWWQIPSRMAYAYAATLLDAAAREPDDLHPKDSCTWQFYGGTLDPKNRTRENSLFFICTQPEKIPTMVDELEDMQGARMAQLKELVGQMQTKRDAVLIGTGVLKRLGKQAGDRIKVTSFNFKGIDLEVDIIGSPPEGTRHDMSCFMNAAYLNAAFDDFKARNRNQPHPMADKNLGLVWLRVDSRNDFERMGAQIMSSPLYANPAVK